MGELLGSALGDLVRSGRIVDIALGLIALEVVLLARIRSRSGRAALDIGLLAHLAAGGFLLLALRAALTGSSWEVVAGWLAGGLVAHLVDLGARLGSRRS